MRQLYTVLCLTFVTLTLSGCGLGSKKTKNIIDMTPKLSVNAIDKIVLNTSEVRPFEIDGQQSKTYKISKSTLIAPPLFANGNIYTSDTNGVITAFSNIDKKALWAKNINYNARDSIFDGGGLVHKEGKLYVTNGSRFLILVDATNGNEIERKEFPDIIRTKPIILQDRVAVVQTVSNQLFAYDFNRAKFMWQHEGLQETLSFSVHVNPILTTVADKKLLVAYYNTGHLFAIDLHTGQEQWIVQLSDNQEGIGLPSLDNQSVSCQPIVVRENIYVASGSGKLYKINLANGNVIWSISANDIQSMNINGDNLFLVNNAKQAAIVNTQNGLISWTADLSDPNSKKRNTAAATFLPPVLSTKDGNIILNIASSLGELYQFSYDSASQNFVSIPKIVKIPKNIKYWGYPCCGDDVYYLYNNIIGFVK